MNCSTYSELNLKKNIDFLNGLLPWTDFIYREKHNNISVISNNEIVSDNGLIDVSFKSVIKQEQILNLELRHSKNKEIYSYRGICKKILYQVNNRFYELEEFPTTDLKQVSGILIEYDLGSLIHIRKQ